MLTCDYGGHRDRECEQNDNFLLEQADSVEHWGPGSGQDAS